MPVAQEAPPTRPTWDCKVGYVQYGIYLPYLYTYLSGTAGAPVARQQGSKRPGHVRTTLACGSASVSNGCLKQPPVAKASSMTNTMWWSFGTRPAQPLYGGQLPRHQPSKSPSSYPHNVHHLCLLDSPALLLQLFRLAQPNLIPTTTRRIKPHSYSSTDAASCIVVLVRQSELRPET
jgi:hypothetical protein